MANVICTEGSLQGGNSQYFVVTSGIKFRTYSDVSSSKAQCQAPLASGANVSNVDAVILNGSFSRDSGLLALVDSQKQVTVWQCSDWQMLKAWPTERAPTRVLFSPDAKHVLVADKTGDVISYSWRDSTESGRPASECILGHMSMLLDMVLSPCGNYIITCDRDEKIRVSRYPDAYTVHSFCLGHTDFVTRVAICPAHPNLLLSTSGDGSLRLWNYLEGAQLDVKWGHQDAGLHTAGNAIDDCDPRIRRQPVPAVTALRVTRQSPALAIVCLDKFNGLLIYSIVDRNRRDGKNDEGMLSYIQRLDCGSPVLDMGCINDTSMLVMCANRSGYLKLLGITADGGQWLEDCLPAFDSEVDFFQGAMDWSTRDRVSGLYKKWFDNMNDYLHKKKERLQAQLVGRSPAAKRLKAN